MNVKNYIYLILYSLIFNNDGFADNCPLYIESSHPAINIPRVENAPPFLFFIRVKNNCGLIHKWDDQGKYSTKIKIENLSNGKSLALGNDNDCKSLICFDYEGVSHRSGYDYYLRAQITNNAILIEDLSIELTEVFITIEGYPEIIGLRLPIIYEKEISYNYSITDSWNWIWTLLTPAIFLSVLLFLLGRDITIHSKIKERLDYFKTTFEATFGAKPYASDEHVQALPGIITSKSEEIVNSIHESRKSLSKKIKRIRKIIEESNKEDITEEKIEEISNIMLDISTSMEVWEEDLGNKLQEIQDFSNQHFADIKSEFQIQLSEIKANSLTKNDILDEFINLKESISRIFSSSANFSRLSNDYWLIVDRSSSMDKRFLEDQINVIIKSEDNLYPNSLFLFDNEPQELKKEDFHPISKLDLSTNISHTNYSKICQLLKSKDKIPKLLYWVTDTYAWDSILEFLIVKNNFKCELRIILKNNIELPNGKIGMDIQSLMEQAIEKSKLNRSISLLLEVKIDNDAIIPTIIVTNKNS